MAKKGLGSGLDTLFMDNTNDIQVKKTLRTSEIEPNRDQPRKVFSDEAIAALADSIREYGVLQPILVRPLGTGMYQIVAGERRWRAARMLGLDEVPVNIKELSDLEAMQIAIVENLQRENLNPLEEASGYSELIEKFGMTQEKVAKLVGRSRSAVANAVRLLTLPEIVQKMVENGDLSAGHARALLAFDDEELLISTAQKAAGGGLTVRQVEKIAQKSTEESMDWFHKLDSYTVEFFRTLDIPVRTLECCSGDLADLKVKSIDVEAWSPRQKKYFEVGSCSNLGDAQARRLGIRVKTEDGNKYFPHTLNNTVVAPPRMLIAFLENNLNEDGSIRIPEALRSYMRKDVIAVPEKKKK